MTALPQQRLSDGGSWLTYPTCPDVEAGDTGIIVVPCGWCGGRKWLQAGGFQYVECHVCGGSGWLAVRACAIEAGLPIAKFEGKPNDPPHDGPHICIEYGGVVTIRHEGGVSGKHEPLTDDATFTPGEWAVRVSNVTTEPIRCPECDGVFEHPFAGVTAVCSRCDEGTLPFPFPIAGVRPGEVTQWGDA